MCAIRDGIAPRAGLVAVRGWAAPAVGAVSWAATVAVGARGGGLLTLVDAMLLLGVLVVVPAAVPLHPAARSGTAAIALAAGAFVAPALLVERGALATVLAVPWLLATATGALVAIWSWWSHHRRLRAVVWPAAAVYLAVGAAWLVMDRADLEPPASRRPSFS